VTWNQLEIHDKPVGLMDIEGYWQALIGFVEQGVREGFVPARTRERILVERDVTRMLDMLGY
jgi:predicted Rossmann-fold nucleotide-binding protein